jgi:nodulation protein E
MKRVLITGLGVFSASGCGKVEFWTNLSQGRSGVGLLQRADASQLNVKIAGEVKGFDPEAHFGREVELMDRFAQLAVVSARQALADAGLPLRFGAGSGPQPERVAVLIGSGLGGAETEDKCLRQLYEQQAVRLHPFSIARMMLNAGASHVTMDIGAQGQGMAIATACSSATHAIGEGWKAVRSGEADIVLAGGSDAPLTHGVLRAWEAMRVLAAAGDDPSRACRPFSADRTGLVIAEGAAVVVLESEESARRRGVWAYAELAGYGASSDAGHITQPSSDGARRAMQAALDSSGASPEDVDYINAHGTATKLNDSTETAAIRALLGKHADRVSVSSTKSMHGHAMGASGAIEIVATALALQHQVVPPTANYTTFDPECDLDVTPNQARARELKLALSNSFAFGGLNAVLAVRRI